MEADELVRMLSYVADYILIWNPEPRQFGLSTKYDGLVALRCRAVILVPTDRQINLFVSTSKGLPAKILSEVIRIFEKVGVDID